ncbi:MAG: hypothetical protein H0W73_16410 [Bacteroidetes bacterium]|nr:hypothetical protein [Bacteroidota bacterium]
MENNFNDQFQNDLAPLPERPQFLKVLCILSFVACGLLIIIYAIGSICLGMSEETITSVWDKIVETQPQFENLDPVVTIYEIGKLCLFNLFANIISLAGVIMMWRLNKIGLFVYAAAELATNFLGMDVGVADGGKSYTSMIVWIIIDLAFVAMYAYNLKNIKPKQIQNSNL